MSRYILRRIALIVVSLIVASFIVFCMTQLLPGDVAKMVLGKFATEEALANLRQELGLNQPFYIQYINWFTNFIRGDWGESIVAKTPILPLLMQRLSNSFKLAGLAVLFYVPISILFGLIAAIKRYKIVDFLISSVSMLFVGLPEFVTGMVLISIFAINLGWLPTSSSNVQVDNFIASIKYYILPAITISIVNLGYITRMMRSSTIDVLCTDYVRAAELKGLPYWKILVFHVLRNSLIPTVTVLTMSIGWLVGGLIVTEVVFNYPGLGSMIIYAIEHRDISLIQATSMMVLIIYALANFTADILYGVLNPQIRLGK